MTVIYNKSKLINIFVILFCILMTIVNFLHYYNFKHDDAFIVFQFAKNIASGKGFAFNDAPIFGSTSPLYTLLCSVIYYFFQQKLEYLSLLMNCCFFSATAYLLYLLCSLSRISSFLSVFVCVIYLLADFDNSRAIQLETNLFFFLIFLSIYIYDCKQRFLSGAILGLCFLARYDAGVLVVMLFLIKTFEDKKIPFKYIIGTSIPILTWFIFAIFELGDIFPHTLGAKAGTDSFKDYFYFNINRFTYIPIISELTRRNLYTDLAYKSFFYFCIFAWCIKYKLERKKIIILFILACAILLTYSFIGPSKTQYWHTAFPATIFKILFIISIAEYLFNKSEVSRIITYAVLLFYLVLYVDTYRTRVREDVSGFWNGERHLRYQAISKYLKLHFLDSKTFMADEIGTLGYLTNKKMIDPYGLINKTNNWSKEKKGQKKVEAYSELINIYKPNLILVNHMSHANYIVDMHQYKIVKDFKWKNPSLWSILLYKKY